MAQKCALIVDDSRTARQVLGQVLAENSLRVETAESAEEALEYLSRSRPDVIFMDHMMPGMDGFQAVRAIKNNPATATIPIMMYTSQEGELYVGQARALGAVGVLPKQIKPVEVSHVLRSLHLLGGGCEPAADGGDIEDGVLAIGAAPPATPAAHSARDVAEELNARDWTDLHRWLQEMFEHHGRELRGDIEKSVARLLREQAGAGHEQEQVYSPGAPALSPARSTITTVLTAALAAIAAVSLWLHLDTQRKWRAAADQNTRLIATLNSRRSLASSDTAAASMQLDAERDALAGRVADLVAALEWGVNQSASYPHDQLPLGDERLETLGGLLEQLRRIGFAGAVRLESHVGDFCYAAGGGDLPVLAADDSPASKCHLLNLLPEEARALSAGQSIAFANFLTTRGGASAIRIEIDARGNAAPLVPYPAALDGLTAGEWNRIARMNNRVAVRLLPDPVAE
jgi:CheY-like chemotaxis protein